MGKISKLLNRIPFFEALRGFMEQWGIWPVLTWVIGVSWAFIVSWWAWVTASLPGWAIALIFTGALAMILAICDFAYGVHIKRKQAHFLDQVVVIDREGLATELEEISRKIAGLVGEFLGPMQEAWWKETESLDTTAMHSSRARIQGQLVEKYSYRHGADVWRLIRRASKVVPIDQGDLWQIQHGIRGDHDLVQVYMFLAALSDDIRTPKAPLPKADPREDALLRSQYAAPQLPPSPEA